MSLFSMLSKKAPNRVFGSMLLGVLSGATYALLIPLMINALRPADPRFATVDSGPVEVLWLKVANAPVAALFAAICLFIVVARTLSQVTLSRVSMTLASELRVNMYNRIARAPLPSLERIGVPKLIGAMTSDLPTVVAGTQLLPDLLVATVTVFGMLGFLLYLNVTVFWFVFGAIIFGVVTYQLPMLLGQRYFIKGGKSQDALQEAIQGLVRGVKELKLNDEKRRAFFNTMLLRYESDLYEAQQGANTVVRISANYGEMLSFFIIGAVTFIFVNYHAINTEELLGAIMVLLYITGPVSGILRLLPEISRSKIALQRVTTLRHMSDSRSVGDAVPELVEQALRQAGARSDNVTALAVEWEGEGDAPDSISTQDLDDQGFASTIQGATQDVQLDEAEIDSAVREIQDAIRKAGKKPH